MSKKPENENQKIVIENLGGQEVVLCPDDQVWMPTQFGRELGEVIVQRTNGNGREVLELGVGSGVLSVLCGKRGSRVTGLDINPKALEATEKNWLKNGLVREDLEVRHSDLFGALSESDKGRYSLLISNPPTFPAVASDRYDRGSRDEWELAGDDGREVLDAVITEGPIWLEKGGKLLTIATSRQGWKRTVSLMDCYWKKWSVIKEVDLPLADYYFDFLPLWEERQAEDGEERVIVDGDQIYQRLYFIEAKNI